MAEEGCIDIRKTWPRGVFAWEDPNCEKDAYGVVMLCKRGHIAPSGGTTLMACTDSGGTEEAKALRSGKLPVTVIQDADGDGVNAEFEVEDWEVVFAAMQIRQKRTTGTPTEKMRLKRSKTAQKRRK